MWGRGGSTGAGQPLADAGPFDLTITEGSLPPDAAPMRRVASPGLAGSPVERRRVARGLSHSRSIEGRTSVLIRTAASFRRRLPALPPRDAPDAATLDGVHTHDDLLEDLSRQAIEAQARALAGFARRLERDPARRPDARSSSIEHPVHRREHPGADVRARRGPDLGAQPAALRRHPRARASPAQALFPYAPADERARRVLSKLRQAPRLIQAARDNIKDPPGHLRQGRPRDAARRAASSSSTTCRAPSRASTTCTCSATWPTRRPRRPTRSRATSSYLENDLAPRGARVVPARPRAVRAEAASSTRASRVGVDRLLAIADARAVERRRRSSGASPARLNGGDPLAAWRAAKADHPAPGPARRGRAAAARRARHVHRAARPGHDPARRAARRRADARVLPLDVRQHVDAGPVRGEADARLLLPHRRRPVVAAGAAGRAPARLQLSRRSGRSRSTRSTRATSCTTSTCGRSSRRLRKSILFAPASFVEGWAHYCEQMMIEAGLRRRATRTSGSASSPRRSSASPASSSASGCTPRTCRWSRACGSSATRRSWRRRARGARPSAARSTRPTWSTRPAS